MDLETAVPIGEGATGKVMRAWSNELDQFVAIKYLKINDPDWVTRLRREAAAIQRIDHPLVPKIHSVDIRTTGRSSLVMQYINGAPLDQIAQRLTLEQRVWLLAKICDAIQAAHQEGLIHRDIKPANILVEQLPDGEIKPWIVDFGLVHDDQAATLTVGGSVMGTPNYMAPEQADGSIEVDRRCDVYGLGATLYFLLTLQKPFDGESISEILSQVVKGDIRPPHKANPRIPRMLSAVCLRAMEHEVQHRYASARALGEVLDEYLRGSVDRSAMLDWRYHWRRLWRLRRPWIVGVSGLAMVLLVSAAGFWWQHIEAQEAAEQIRRFTALVEQRNQTFRLAQMSPGMDIAPVRDRLAEAYESEEATLSELPAAARPAAKAALGRGYQSLGLADAALRLLLEAQDAGSLDGPALFSLAMVQAQRYQRALQEVALTRDEDLRADLTAAAQREWRDPAIDALRSAQSAGIAQSDYGTALIALLDGRFEDVSAPALAAVSGTPWWFESHIAIGDAAAEQARQAVIGGDAERAEARYREAVSAYEMANDIAPSSFEALAKRCAMWAGMVHARASILRQDPTEWVEAGQSSCEEALRSDSSAFRPLAHQSQMLQDRGIVEYINGGNPEQTFEQAQALLDRAMAINNQDVEVLYLTSVLLRRRAFIAVGQDRDPAPLVEEGTEILEQLVDGDPTRFDYFNAWGNLLLDQAEYDRAQDQDVRDLMQQAIEKFNESLQRRPSQNIVLMNLAVTESMLAEEHAKYDDAHAAEMAFERALDRYDQALGLDASDFDTIKNRAVLATQYARFLGGQDARAFELLEQAYVSVSAGLENHPDDRTAQLATASAVRAIFELFDPRATDFRRLDEALHMIERSVEKGEGRHQSPLQEAYLSLLHQAIWTSATVEQARSYADRLPELDWAGEAARDEWWTAALSGAAIEQGSLAELIELWQEGQARPSVVPEGLQQWIAMASGEPVALCDEQVPVLICARFAPDALLASPADLYTATGSGQTPYWWQEELAEFAQAARN